MTQTSNPLSTNLLDFEDLDFFLEIQKLKQGNFKKWKCKNCHLKRYRGDFLKRATQWIEQSYRLYFKPDRLKICRARSSENQFQKRALTKSYLSKFENCVSFSLLLAFLSPKVSKSIRLTSNHNKLTKFFTT